MNPYKNFGKKLQVYRESTGITQAQVAQRLGLISAQYISNIECGIVLPSRKHLKKLVSLYSINPDNLFKYLLRIESDSLAKAIYGPKEKGLK